MEGAFLEMAEPNIETAMQRLANRGIQQVVVLPLLLFEAGHAKRDIPRAAQQAAERHGLQLLFASALGTHPRMIELSVQRFHSTIRQAALDPGDVLWVLVGAAAETRQQRPTSVNFWPSVNGSRLQVHHGKRS